MVEWWGGKGKVWCRKKKKMSGGVRGFWCGVDCSAFQCNSANGWKAVLPFGI
jgi:hypothetical protein